MNTTDPAPLNATQLVRQLDAEAISRRLEEMRHEREALLVLLRAAQRASRGKGSLNGR